MPSHWGFWKLLRTTNLLAKSSAAKALVLKSKGVQAQDTPIGKESPNKGPFEAGNWALASAQSSVGLEERPGTGQGEEGLWDGWRKYNVSPYGRGFHFKTLESGFQKPLSFLCRPHQHAWKMWTWQHRLSLSRKGKWRVKARRNVTISSSDGSDLEPSGALLSRTRDDHCSSFLHSPTHFAALSDRLLYAGLMSQFLREGLRI